MILVSHIFSNTYFNFCNIWSCTWFYTVTNILEFNVIEILGNPLPPPSALRRKIIIKNKKKHHHHHKKTTTPSPENQSTENIENNGEVQQHAPPLQIRQVLLQKQYSRDFLYFLLEEI